MPRDIVKEAEEILSKATAGPWWSKPTDLRHLDQGRDVYPMGGQGQGGSLIAHVEREADDALIVAAPSLIAELVAEIRRLRSERE